VALIALMATTQARGRLSNGRGPDRRRERTHGSHGADPWKAGSIHHAAHVTDV